MVKYLAVDELLFEGHEDCSIGCDKEDFDLSKPHIVITSDPAAECWRGVNRIYYKGRVIASELMTRPLLGIELNGPSIGLYRNAEKWLLKNLSQVIRDFK